MASTPITPTSLEVANDGSAQRLPLQPVVRRGPEGRVRLRDHLRSLGTHRELLASLTVREIRIRYKQTALGVGWAVFQPLSLMLLFTLVFGYLIRVDTGDVPYPVYSYTALLPWTLLSSSLSFAVPSLVKNDSLIQKIYFPREVLPLASVFAALFDYLVAGLLYIGLLLAYQVHIGAAALWTPLILLVQLTFIIGISLLTSALNVSYRDVKYIIPLLVQLWMYLTPIIYTVDLIPERFRSLYMLNPMAGIIESYRRAILQDLPPDPTHFATASALALAFLALGYLYFKRAEKVFADVI